jgi:CMP-N,N'-diacetyllegionaminic acid synthase
MREPPRVLAVVPARGGSKRLPRKNVLPLGGKPLIAWTLDAAVASGVFVDVLVSTDDTEIADISRRCGAQVPWLRPAELATDIATSSDVLRHALTQYESRHRPVDAVMLLQPTSPFRSTRSIRAAVEQYLAQPAHTALVSVSRPATHPAWCFSVDGTQLVPIQGWDVLALRSQDLPPVYALNGAIYLFPSEQVRSGGLLLTPQMQAFVMDDPVEPHDIDTEADWRVAEVIAQLHEHGTRHATE